jgi:Galactose oxidase, central domain
MKLTQVRDSLAASIILVSCCISIAFAASAAAAPSSFPDWARLPPHDPPPARSYLAMTYDPVSGKIVAFGGFDGTGYLNDTLSFDGTNWVQLTTQSAPSARAAAQMTYDSITQKIVLFGGFDGTNYLGDTWLWDGSTLQWTQATPNHQPTAVTGPMLFPDPNGRADLFGGFDGQFYQLTMWQWNGSDWTQLSPPTVPFARSSAAVATNTSTGQVVMFGGLADVNPNNTWTYDGTTWTLQSPAVQPLLVYAASAAFDPGLQGVVLFGGGSGGVDQNTTWLWDQAAANWIQLSTALSPPAREGAGMAYDAALHRVILFGGQDNNGYFNDTWELISTSTPTPTPTPTATATPSVTSTPTPTATPTPTPTRPTPSPRLRPTPLPRPTPP